MISEMKGWKVLTKNYCSARSSKWDEYLMSKNNRNFKIKYIINQKVYPKVKGSKLFFFKDFHYAKIFSKNNEIIVPCIGYNCEKIKSIAYAIVSVSNFWKLKRNKKSVKSLSGYPPEGTYVAESIMCLDEKTV